MATLRTEKNDTIVTIPILPLLDEILRAGPCGGLAFSCGEKAKPLKRETFGNKFRVACSTAGVFGKSVHWLSKVGATRAANNGATVAELEAIFEWQGGRMAALYTQAADRARLAKAGMAKLEANQNDERTSIPSPKRQVRDSKEKNK